MRGFGFRVQGLGLGFGVWGLGLGFIVWGLGLKASGLGLATQEHAETSPHVHKMIRQEILKPEEADWRRQKAWGRGFQVLAGSGYL